jgi:hypothetical protein
MIASIIILKELDTVLKQMMEQHENEQLLLDEWSEKMKSTQSHVLRLRQEALNRRADHINLLCELIPELARNEEAAYKRGINFVLQNKKQQNDKKSITDLTIDQRRELTIRQREKWQDHY